MSKSQPQSCPDDLSGAEKAHHEFLCQGIFERRKTQYTFFLFFLGAVGVCSSIVLATLIPVKSAADKSLEPAADKSLESATEKPRKILLILMIPIFLQIPVYATWWYQRNQISMLDRAREKVLEGKKGMVDEVSVTWHNKPEKFANDAVLLGTPLALVGIARWLFSPGTPFLSLWLFAIAAFVVSLIVAVLGTFRDKRARAPMKQGNGGSSSAAIQIAKDKTNIKVGP